MRDPDTHVPRLPPPVPVLPVFRSPAIAPGWQGSASVARKEVFRLVYGKFLPLIILCGVCAFISTTLTFLLAVLFLPLYLGFVAPEAKSRTPELYDLTLVPRRQILLFRLFCIACAIAVGLVLDRRFFFALVSLPKIFSPGFLCLVTGKIILILLVGTLACWATIQKASSRGLLSTVIYIASVIIVLYSQACFQSSAYVPGFDDRLDLIGTAFLSSVPRCSNFHPLLSAQCGSDLLAASGRMLFLWILTSATFTGLIAREVWFSRRVSLQNACSAILACVIPLGLALLSALYAILICPANDHTPGLFAITFTITPLILFSLPGIFTLPSLPESVLSQASPRVRSRLILAHRALFQVWKPLVFALLPFCIIAVRCPEFLPVVTFFALPTLVCSSLILLALARLFNIRSFLATAPIFVLVCYASPGLTLTILGCAAAVSLALLLLPVSLSSGQTLLSRFALPRKTPDPSLALSPPPPDASPALSPITGLSPLQLKSLRDLPDFIPPILVLLFRQTFSDKSFFILFALLAASCFLFSPGMICLFLALLIQPIRICQQSRQFLKTAPLLRSSGIAPYKAILYNWIAVNVQTLVFFVSLLPFLILAQIVGSPTKSDPSFSIFSSIILSFFLTALATLLAVIPNFFVQTLMTFAVVFTVFSLIKDSLWSPDIPSIAALACFTVLMLATASHTSQATHLKRWLKFRRLVALISPVYLLAIIAVDPVLPVTSPSIWIAIFIFAAYPVLDLALEPPAPSLPSRFSRFSWKSLFLPSTLSLPAAFSLSLATLAVDALILWLSALFSGFLPDFLPLSRCTCLLSIACIASCMVAANPGRQNLNWKPPFGLLLLVFCLTGGIFNLISLICFSSVFSASLAAAVSVTGAFLLLARKIPKTARTPAVLAPRCPPV